MSSNFDGTNKKTVLHGRTNIFIGVASYLDYIYITDVRKHSDEEYYMWWVSKSNNDNFGKYKLKEKPRGVTVYGRTENYLFQTRQDIGSCTSSPSCDHLCLPIEGVKRKCVCSTGYQLIGETQCDKI